VGRTLIVSSSAAARLGRARAWLEGILARPHRGVRILGPTRGATDDLVRSLPGGAFGVERSSVMVLAAELAAPVLAARGLAASSSLGALALATRVASELPRDSFFAPILDAPGFPTALERTLRELRLAGVSPHQLEGLDRGGADLARALDGFVRGQRDAGVADPAEVLAVATEVVQNGGEVAPLLMLDLAVRNRAEADFLAALVARSSEVLATVPAGDPETRGRLEGSLERAAEGIEDDAPGRLGRLRRHLFSEAAPDEPVPVTDARVTLVSAGGEGRECAEIAVRVRELAEGGVPFDDVAVGLREAALLGLLEEAFSRADIPFAATREARRPDPAGRAFLALLACAEEGLSASRFAEYLSLGQVPRADDRGAPAPQEVPWVEPVGEQLALSTPEPTPAPAAGEVEEDAESDAVLAGSLRAPRAWEHLLVDAAVIGGRERWRRRLDGLLAELELRRRELADDEPRRDALDRRIAALQRLRAFALPLIEVLAALPQQATWGGWGVALEDLAGRALRRPEGVLEVLHELAPMAGVGPVGLPEVARVLGPRLRFLQRASTGPRYGKVFVGTIDELRGRSFHTVFVPGLADGVFPRRTLEDPLLLDDARQSLGHDLAIGEDRVQRERLLLSIAVGAAREAVVVSWSRYDLRQGRARTPSFYALDVARAASGELEPLDELQAAAARAAAARQGWPAPKEPRRALDAGEFDLAVVAELRRQGAQMLKGAGNYLLEVEPVLARAITAQGWRWQSELSDLDGLLARPTTSHREPQPGLAEVLRASSLRQRPYSPTALQHYAACPYRFLLQAIHRLRPREEAEALETMDPLTRGSLFHTIQFEVLTELRAAGELPLRSGRLEPALERLDSVIERVASFERDRLAPAIERVWHNEIQELRIDLRGWLRALAEDSAWAPIHFELAFGLPGDERDTRDRASSDLSVEVAGGFLVRGSIDLVESSGPTLRVTDHKTGRAAAKDGVVVGGGGVLQPLLYALAAERLLGRPVEAGRLWYATRRGGYAERLVDASAEHRDRLREVLEIVDRAVEEVFFPALPAPDACRYCDYRLVCGPDEELRAGIKRPKQRPAALEDLVVLRGMR
jgi:RecB family exonuclease